MSKNSAVCVSPSILRLFNVKWCYLTPRASAEGMLFRAHRTCTPTWKDKHLFFAFFSVKWMQGRESMISLAAFYLFPGSSMCHKETSKNNFLLELGCGEEGDLKPWRNLRFWNLLPLCITNTLSAQNLGSVKATWKPDGVPSQLSLVMWWLPGNESPCWNPGGWGWMKNFW